MPNRSAPWLFVAGLLLGCPKPPPPPPPPSCPDGQIWNGIECVCPAGLEWVDVLEECWAPRNDTPPVTEEIIEITSFALPLRDPPFVKEWTDHVKGQGYNTLRTGFEFYRWSEERARMLGVQIGAEYLPPGPHPTSPENLRNIERFLEVTARSGVWVELIPVFTIKGLGSPDTADLRRETTLAAIDLVKRGGYRHIFWSWANEWRRGDISKEEVIAGLQNLRTTGHLVTTDAFGELVEGNPDRVWDAVYDEDLLPYVDMVAFHPRRNPEPTVHDLQAAVRRYAVREKKLAVLLNETTSWASDAEIERYPELAGSFLIYNSGRPTEEDRRRLAREYLDKVRQVRDAMGPKLAWGYHCISCFADEADQPGKPDFWMPAWTR